MSTYVLIHGAGGGSWASTGHVFPEPFDPAAVFAHDLPAGPGAPFEKPWPLGSHLPAPARPDVLVGWLERDRVASG